MTTKDEIKVKLVEAGYIDNEYMDRYADLMLLNLLTKKERGKTQVHHIIPVNTIKKDDEDIWGGQLRYQRIKQARKEKSDSVNLLYKDHLLAHAYLTLCQNLDIIQIDYEAKAERRLKQTTSVGYSRKKKINWTWMHKGESLAQVDKQDIESYIKDGWLLGKKS